MKRSALVLFCLAFLVSRVIAQEGFGRFGYTKTPVLPGFECTQSGFKARFSGSDALSFPSPLKIWNPVATNMWRQVVVTDGGIGKPSKIRFDLWDCGISMYFPSGIELNIKSTASPFLSWKEGSVKDGIPTPKSDWVCLSFQDNQPPIVLGFPEDTTQMQLTGDLGNWTLRSEKNFKGWVRFALPMGLEPYRSTTAKGLGKLSERCSKEEELWYAPIADVPDPVLEDDSDGVVATWQLPRKRTVVPNTFYLSPLGGYLCRINTPTVVYGSSTSEGPIIFTTQPTLSVRFPIKRIPAGRGLSIGEPIPQNYQSANWKDPISIVSLALGNTLSGRNREDSQRARDLLTGYYDLTTPEVEPNTKQSVFYKANGAGMLQAAVHSLLGQSVRTGEVASMGEDPQFISLFWRIDPYTGSLGVGLDDANRIAAIAAISGSFSSDPKMRLRSAMFQCCISGARGLNIWKKRVGLLPGDVKQVEPLLGIRKGLFALNVQSPQSPVVANWLSEVRCYGDAPMWLQKQDTLYEFCWTAVDKIMGTISLESAYNVRVSNKRNLQSLYFSQRIGYSEIRYEPESPGQCTANLIVPDWANPIPLTTLPPEYSEVTL